jgi:predicted MFS family arabinose efflux permease
MAGKRSHPQLTLAVLAIAGLAYAILSSAVVPVLPTIQHDLNTSETGVAWLLTGYLLSASVATAILGRLGEICSARSRSSSGRS